MLYLFMLGSAEPGAVPLEDGSVVKGERRAGTGVRAHWNYLILCGGRYPGDKGSREGVASRAKQSAEGEPPHASGGPETCGDSLRCSPGGELVEAAGIEPASQNLRCQGVYVCVPRLDLVLGPFVDEPLENQLQKFLTGLP